MWTFPVDSSSQSYKDRDSIYVINFSSSNLKEKFDSGNLEFRLSFRQTSSESKNDIIVTETFRDDSRSSTYTGSIGSSSGKVCQIVRGSIIDEFVDKDRYAFGSGQGSGRRIWVCLSRFRNNYTKPIRIILSFWKSN